METLLWVIWPVLIISAVFYIGGLIYGVFARSKSIIADLAELSETINANAPEQVSVEAARANTGKEFGKLRLQRYKLKKRRSKQKQDRQRRLIDRIKSIEIDESRFG